MFIMHNGYWRFAASRIHRWTVIQTRTLYYLFMLEIIIVSIQIISPCDCNSNYGAKKNKKANSWDYWYDSRSSTRHNNRSSACVCGTVKVLISRPIWRWVWISVRVWISCVSKAAAERVPRCCIHYLMILRMCCIKNVCN